MLREAITDALVFEWWQGFATGAAAALTVAAAIYLFGRNR